MKDMMRSSERNCSQILGSQLTTQLDRLQSQTSVDFLRI